MSTTTVLDSKSLSNLTTLLDLCALIISTLQFHVCLERVRVNRMLEIRHSILEISPLEQVRLSMWLTPTKELITPLIGSSSLPSK